MAAASGTACSSAPAPTPSLDGGPTARPLRPPRRSPRRSRRRPCTARRAQGGRRMDAGTLAHARRARTHPDCARRHAAEESRQRVAMLVDGLSDGLADGANGVITPQGRRPSRDEHDVIGAALERPVEDLRCRLLQGQALPLGKGDERREGHHRRRITPRRARCERHVPGHVLEAGLDVPRSDGLTRVRPRVGPPGGGIAKEEGIKGQGESRQREECGRDEPAAKERPARAPAAAPAASHGTLLKKSPANVSS